MAINTSTGHLKRTTNLPSLYPFTIMGWFKYVDGAPSWTTHFALEGASNWAYIGTNTSGIVVLYNGVTQYNLSPGLTDGGWYHIAMSARGTGSSDLKAYLNGVLNKSGSHIATGPYNYMSMGGGGNSDFFWQTSMAQVRVWDTELSEAEILAEKNSRYPVRTANLNSNFQLVNSSSAVTDSSGNGYNAFGIGTISDGEAFTSSFQMSKRIIAPSGGNYTSLNAWQAGEVENLVASNSYAVAEISGTWENPEEALINISGWTTSPTNTVTIRATGSARHSGVYSTSSYRLYTTGSSVSLFQVSSDYVKLDGIQLLARSNGHYTTVIDAEFNPAQFTCSNVLAIGHPQGNHIITVLKPSWFITNHLFYNCVFIHTGSTYNHGDNCCVLNPGHPNTNQYSYFFKNCTLVGGNYSFNLSDTNEFTCSLVNCIVTGSISSDFYLPFGNTVTGSNNVFSSGYLVITGSNNYSSSRVRFVDPLNYNYRLANDDTVAKNRGYDLYNNGIVGWNTDIAGNTRTSGSWDIGAFESLDSILRYIKTFGRIFMRGRMNWKV